MTYKIFTLSYLIKILNLLCIHPSVYSGVCGIEYGTLQGDFAWWGAPFNATCLNKCKSAKMDIFDEKGVCPTLVFGQICLNLDMSNGWHGHFGIGCSPQKIPTPLWTKFAISLLVLPLKVHQRASSHLNVTYLRQEIYPEIDTIRL